MRNWIRAVLAACAMSAPLTAYAQTLPPRGCDARRAAIQQEIAYARKYRRSARVDELQIAMARIDANCNEATLMSEGQRIVDAAYRKMIDLQWRYHVAKERHHRAGEVAGLSKQLGDAHTQLQLALIEADD